MKDPTTTNLACQDAANNTTFTGPDDVWGNGNATNRETGCVDALFARADRASRCCPHWLGRNGMDGAGGAWPIRVGLNDAERLLRRHPGPDRPQLRPTSGSARSTSSRHEMGHGIDDHTPGGISGSGTQEFVADTFGAATEWFANEPSAVRPARTSWSARRSTWSAAARSATCTTRRRSATRTATRARSRAPRCTPRPARATTGSTCCRQGTNPTNGQPTSPTCNSTTITGLGIQNAIKIMYNAMLMKTTGSSYLKYRTWTLQAAKNLFPGTCTEFNTVKAAWNAVSVPAQTGRARPAPAAAASRSTNPGNQTGTVGTAITFTLSATGGTTPYTCRATGLPAGLTHQLLHRGHLRHPDRQRAPSTSPRRRPRVPAARPAVVHLHRRSARRRLLRPEARQPGLRDRYGAPWSASAGVIDNTSCQPAHSGTWKAWLDGYGSTHTDTLSQSVAIPAGCTRDALVLPAHRLAETTTTTQYDKLTVKAGTTTLATYSNLNKASGYSLQVVQPVVVRRVRRCRSASPAPRTSPSRPPSSSTTQA